MKKIKKTNLLLLLAATAITWSSHAQNSFCKEYVANVPGDRESAIYDLEKSLDDRLLTTGHTVMVGGQSDFYLSRINPVNGTQLGLVQLDSGEDDRAFSCTPTSDGGAISVGYAHQTMTEQERINAGIVLSSGNSTFSIVKFNSDGSIGWEHHLDIGKFDDMAFSVMARADGTFLALGRGHTDDDAYTGKFLSLVHVDLAGTLLSVNNYTNAIDAGNELFGVDMLEAANGDIFILGVDGYGSAGANDAYASKGLADKIILLKLDSNLDFVSTREVNFTQLGATFGTGLMAYDMTFGSNGNIAIVGHVVSPSPLFGSKSSGFILEMTTGVGVLGVNVFQMNSRDNTIPMAVQSLANGYLITGTTLEESFVHFVDNNLIAGASSLFDVDASTESHSIFQEGNFFFFGGTHSIGTISSLALLKKQSPNINCCEIPWDSRRVAGIDMMTAFPVYVKREQVPLELPDLSLVSVPHIEFTNCASMAPLLSNLELKIEEEMLVFPNPTSGELNVQVSNFLDGDRIELWNPAGKLIATRMVTNNLTTLEVGDLSAGTYIVSYNSGDQTYRKKVTVSGDQ